MSYTPNILVFAGSAREGSYNKKLARVAAAAVDACGGKAVYIDLRDMPMPLFDEDLEARDGEHPNAKRFKDYLKVCDGFIIASPENNSTYSALLKNAIDWASRRRPGEARFACFAGKYAAIMSASPGQLGGLRGLLNLRALLANIQVTVLPDQLAVSGADKAFDDNGSLRDQSQAEAVQAIAARLVSLISALKA